MKPSLPFAGARAAAAALAASAALAAAALPASASCQQSMVGAYRIACETAARGGDDATALDACRAEADRIAECERAGEPVARGAFLRAAALAALARAYADTNQRARARAAYLEAAAAFETSAKRSDTRPSDRHAARSAASSARAAAAAL